MNHLQKGFLLIRELGMKQLFPYAAYQIRLRSGFLQRATPTEGGKSRLDFADIESLQVPLTVTRTDALAETSRTRVLDQAEEILEGNYHPFGGTSAPLTFDLHAANLQHWTRYGSSFNGQDIKFIWEPARFTWAYALIQAAVLSGDDRYASEFWRLFEAFVENNPVNLGPNWASAQEVALRMLPLLLGWNDLKEFTSSTHARREMIVLLVEQSAFRIQSTLDYARSQNNNHLLSEALGLILAGSYLAGHHPLAARWKNRGFDEFERAILTQVEPDGTYSQHSTNYHRMMLQLALVYYVYAQSTDRLIPRSVMERLVAASRWLIAQVDTSSGKAPNLGHNDGTLLLPFGATGFEDYHPTLQASSLAFLDQPAFAPGPWDELAHWLVLANAQFEAPQPLTLPSSPAVLRVGSDQMWGMLRAVRYRSRPAHADQLAVDLWWDGVNISPDAGTFLYNAPAPWDNALAKTAVHNTVSLAGQDQMIREGKFLWLNRVNAAQIPLQNPHSRSAEILWRTQPPIRHTRTLTYLPGEGFSVGDTLTPLKSMQYPITADLQWLLPDWVFSLAQKGIVLTHEDCRIRIDFEITPADAANDQLSLIRAGEVLAGKLENPIRGWVSPTYNQKEPALSLVLRVPFQKEIQLVSRWYLTDSPNKTG